MSEETIATKLRQAREEQGKTHEQIHRQLGLSLNVLQAVESGNFKVVEPIYIRMILKTYADHLGLDGAAILKQYNDQFGAPPPPLEVPPPPTPGPHPQVALGDDPDLPAAPGISPSWQPSPLPGGAFAQPTPSRSRGGLLLLGGGVVLVVVLLALYWSDKSGEGPRTSALPERVAPQVKPPAGPRPELAPHPAQTPVEGSAQPQAQPTTPLAEPAKAPPDTTVPRKPAALAEPATPAETPASKPAVETPAPKPTTTAPAPAGALVLELEVVAPTWVRIRWDKGGFLETMLQPGDNRRLQANTQFLVWAGNSKGLRYRFQGQPVQEVNQSDPSHTVRFKATKAGVSLIDRETFDQLSEAVRGQDTLARARRDSVP